MTPNELRAWAAGFFDGEGSTGCYKNGNHRYCRATVSQTDKKTLMQFYRAVGKTGSITGPYRLPRRKPIWTWSAHGYDASVHALFQIWAYLSQPKRDQASEAFAVFEAYKTTRRVYKRRTK